MIFEFESLIEKCLCPNICQHNDLLYRVPLDIGIPIGSPLGSLLAEEFMSRLEVEFFQSGHSLLTHIAFWDRYVDDVFCIWTGSINSLLELHELKESQQYTQRNGILLMKVRNYGMSLLGPCQTHETSPKVIR